jgi:hypothetical protein
MDWTAHRSQHQWTAGGQPANFLNFAYSAADLLSAIYRRAWHNDFVRRKRSASVDPSNTT